MLKVTQLTCVEARISFMFSSFIDRIFDYLFMSETVLGAVDIETDVAHGLMG